MIFSVVSVIFPSCTYLSDHRTFPFISTLTGKLLILLYLIVMTSSKNPVSFGVILIPTRRISPGFVGRLSYVAAVQPQVVLASTITRGLSPVFLTSMVVSFISDLSKVPKLISEGVTLAVVFGMLLLGLSLPVICFK